MPNAGFTSSTPSPTGSVPRGNPRALIWWFYRGLKAYCRDPAPQRGTALRARFDRILKRRTGFAPLDRRLARLHANKAALLIARDRPDIPLHTNSAENAIRCQVAKRKISGGTRGDRGRNCRDAFLGLAFWDYLGARLGCTDPGSLPNLPQRLSAPLPRT
jgi:hypothetical protein